MDKDQAKFLLEACQPSGLDDNRSEVVEALAIAEADDEINAWLTEERASDRALAVKLRELEPPADLRSRLLIGARASQKKPLWRRWSLPLGMAALFMLGIGIATLIRPPGYMVDEETPTLVAWQKSCVGIFSHPFFSLDYFDESYEPLEQYLIENGTQVAGDLPFADGITTPFGCSVLEWRDAPVSLACFNSEADELVHLFAIPSEHLEDRQEFGSTLRRQVKSFATVTWESDDLVLMVASQLEGHELDSLLEQNAQVIAAWLDESRPLLVANG